MLLCFLFQLLSSRGEALDQSLELRVPNAPDGKKSQTSDWQSRPGPSHAWRAKPYTVIGNSELLELSRCDHAYESPNILMLNHCQPSLEIMPSKLHVVIWILLSSHVIVGFIVRVVHPFPAQPAIKLTARLAPVVIRRAAPFRLEVTEVLWV